jgi:hypothetical protein
MTAPPSCRDETASMKGHPKQARTPLTLSALVDLLGL